MVVVIWIVGGVWGQNERYACRTTIVSTTVENKKTSFLINNNNNNEQILQIDRLDINTESDEFWR